MGSFLLLCTALWALRGEDKLVLGAILLAVYTTFGPSWEDKVYVEGKLCLLSIALWALRGEIRSSKLWFVISGFWVCYFGVSWLMSGLILIAIYCTLGPSREDEVYVGGHYARYLRHFGPISGGLLGHLGDHLGAILGVIGVILGLLGAML